jgi:hypothetical protein
MAKEKAMVKSTANGTIDFMYSFDLKERGINKVYKIG